eukprot:504508-Rhodomonas_salina.1
MAWLREPSSPKAGMVSTHGSPTTSLKSASSARMKVENSSDSSPKMDTPTWAEENTTLEREESGAGKEEGRRVWYDGVDHGDDEHDEERVDDRQDAHPVGGAAVQP